MDCDQCDRAPVAVPTCHPEAWPWHEFQPAWWRMAPSRPSEPRSSPPRHCLRRQRWLLHQSWPHDPCLRRCPTLCETLPAATTPARAPTPVSCPAPPEPLFPHRYFLCRYFLFHELLSPSFLPSLFYPRLSSP